MLEKSFSPLVLELGCGPVKRPGVVAIDHNPHSAADIVHDLNEFPYPFADNTFDEIVCEHVLEHLVHLVPVMEELHRIGRPGGLIRVWAPYFSSVFYFRDPTHKTPFSLHTFDYFIAGTEVRKFRYSEVEFALRKAEFPLTAKAGYAKRLMFRMINRYRDFYEHYLAFIIPRHLIYFELEVVKEPPGI